MPLIDNGDCHHFSDAGHVKEHRSRGADEFNWGKPEPENVVVMTSAGCSFLCLFCLTGAAPCCVCWFAK